MGQWLSYRMRYAGECEQLSVIMLAFVGWHSPDFFFSFVCLLLFFVVFNIGISHLPKSSLNCVLKISFIVAAFVLKGFRATKISESAESLHLLQMLQPIC